MLFLIMLEMGASSVNILEATVPEHRHGDLSTVVEWGKRCS